MLAENIVHNAERTEDGDVIINQVPVRAGDALYFALEDIRHFQDTDSHLRPDQLLALKVKRMPGRYVRQQKNNPRKFQTPISAQDELQVKIKHYSPAARLSLEAEKLLARRFPNNAYLWRGRYANIAQQSAGLKTQYGQEPLTYAGNALMKHGNRIGSTIPTPKGAYGGVNKQAQALVEDILFDDTAIKTQQLNRYPKKYINVKYLIDIVTDFGKGNGVRYGLTNSGKIKFIGFLEPDFI